MQPFVQFIGCTNLSMLSSPDDLLMLFGWPWIIIMLPGSTPASLARLRSSWLG